MQPREIPARAATVYGLDLAHWGYHLLISAQSTVGGNKRTDDDSYGVCIEFLYTWGQSNGNHSHLAEEVMNTEYDCCSLILNSELTFLVWKHSPWE